MTAVEVAQKTYEMPPQVGFSVAYFLTVADIDRSVRFYEKVFGGRILSRGDSSGAPGYIQIANMWLLVNVGGGPTPDKPSVTLRVPDPKTLNSFMNIRVADIHACYELWKSRGAEFITEPIPKYGEIRCYIAILTATLLRSARAPISRTVNPWRGSDADSAPRRRLLPTLSDYDSALVDTTTTVARAAALASE